MAEVPEANIEECIIKISVDMFQCMNHLRYNRGQHLHEVILKF